MVLAAIRHDGPIRPESISSGSFSTPSLPLAAFVGLGRRGWDTCVRVLLGIRKSERNPLVISNVSVSGAAQHPRPRSSASMTVPFSHGRNAGRELHLGSEESSHRC